MKREYYSNSGLWLVLTTVIIYIVVIYFMFDESLTTFIQYLPFVAILIINSLMLILYGRELFSKKPLLTLEEDQMIYRAMTKTHTILYKDIQKIQRTYNGSRNKKQINRIGIQLHSTKKPIFIIIQSINYDSEKLFEEIMIAVYKKEA